MISIGGGVLSTLRVDSSTAQWIGYQIIFGSGTGAAMPMVNPLLASFLKCQLTSSKALIGVMAVLPQNEISIGNGIIIFCQFLGGAIFLAIAESLFTSRLLREIAANAPSVDAQAVINAGAEAVATVVNSENLAAVIEAYNVAITTTYVSLSAYLSWNRSIRTHCCIVRHGCRRCRCVLRFVWDALGQCEREITDGWRGMISFSACLITASWKGYLSLSGIATQKNFRLLDFLYSLAKA